MSNPSDIDLEGAASRLQGVAHRTPVMTSTQLDRLTGSRVLMKAENLQRVGAFKFRGAFNRIAMLSPAEVERGVVTSSSGNHAQATALAAAMRGTTATILVPSDAPAGKVAATRGYGATVVTFDRAADDREELTRNLAAETGRTIVHPYDDPYVIAGAGTAGLELIDAAPELDALLVPTGGGGLLAGCAVAAASSPRRIQVLGVEPAASDDWQRSFAEGRRIYRAAAKTVADGLQLATPGRLNFAVASSLVSKIVTVTDEEIRAAVRFLFERAKLVVEPSGAVGIAALLSGRCELAGATVGVVLSGGNLDAARAALLFGSPPADSEHRAGDEDTA